MVNTEDFINRLEIILDYHSLNASSFADKIGVQRSSISHLLSGRNKPSLDFILKIVEVFPDVDLYWILNGKGTFPKSDEKTVLKTEKHTSAALPLLDKNPENLFSEIENSNKKEPIKIKDTIQNNSDLVNTNSEIEKIVFFYKNGTFKIFTPQA